MQFVRAFLASSIAVLVAGTGGCSSSDSGTSGTGGTSSGGASSGGASSGGSDGGGSDVCKLPQDSGPCDAAMPRWWFNTATGKCEMFSYGGCEGNANNFESAAECVQACAPNTTNACDAITCGATSSCVWFGDRASCAVACGEGCPSTAPCGCGNSCMGCKDCVQVCVPSN